MEQSDDEDDGDVNSSGMGTIPVNVLKVMFAKRNAEEKDEEDMEDRDPVASSDGKENEDDLTEIETESDKQADLSFANGNVSKACDELKLMLWPECTVEQIGANRERLAYNGLEVLVLNSMMVWY